MQKNKKNGEKTSTIGVVFLCAAILAFSVVIGRTVVPGFEYKEQNADRESEQTTSASSDAGQFAVDAPYIGEPSKISGSFSKHIRLEFTACKRLETYSR